ncbi:MAG: hypothetical protein ACI8W9_001222, partial [Psychromonas sp.]
MHSFCIKNQNIPRSTTLINSKSRLNKKSLLALVNRDLSFIRRLAMEQGSQSSSARES